MILRALVRLAERERLAEDPDFTLAPVAWLVRVTPEGRIGGISDTRAPENRGRKKTRLVAKNVLIPRPPGRTSGDKAFFFVDKSEYTFGVLPAGDGPTRAPEKLAARFALFLAQIRDCVDATSDEGALAVLRALEDVAAGRQDVRLPEGCATNDLFAFVYEPDVDLLVHQRPVVQEYWRSRRREEAATSRAFACIVTGDLVVEPGNFPKVKHVPGGQSGGVPLVSFNAPAFLSYGLSSNENAPISRSAAEASATALQRLLHPAFPDPRPERRGETLPRRHLRLTEDTVVCYWSNDVGADPLLDAFAAFFEPDAGEVGELYRSAWRGRLVAVENAGAFYCLTLSGAQGRMIVRDWFESSVADVEANLANHFADLDIVRNTPPPKGGGLPDALPLRALLRALAPLGRHDAVPPSLATQIVSAALRGTPYPLAVLQRGIERARAEAGRADWADLERRDARAALIKAVLNRRRRQSAASPIPEIPVALDPTLDSPGYLCGRLMALVERLQQVALGDVNASVVDRYFGAASATPRAVFVRLLRNAQHHARKAQDDAKTAGAAIWLKRQVDDISARFDPRKNGFPAFLPLEEQGLFILGYHQQRHALWTKRSGETPPPETGEALAST